MASGERKARAWAKKAFLDQQGLEEKSAVLIQNLWRAKVARREFFGRQADKERIEQEKIVRRALNRLKVNWFIIYCIFNNRF